MDDPKLSRKKHLSEDGTLTEEAKGLIIARMRVKVREQLRGVRLEPGDMIDVRYVWTVED